MNIGSAVKNERVYNRLISNLLQYQWNASFTFSFSVYKDRCKDLLYLRQYHRVALFHSDHK